MLYPRDIENRIKEQQLWLFADRISTAKVRSSQLQPYFLTFAGVLMTLLRQFGLPSTALARATADTIRTRLLKIGARITVSRYRTRIKFASVYPLQSLFARVLAALCTPPAPPDRPPTGRSLQDSDALLRSASGGVCPASGPVTVPAAESASQDPSPTSESGLRDLRSVIPNSNAGWIGVQCRSVPSGRALVRNAG